MPGQQAYTAIARDIQRLAHRGLDAPALRLEAVRHLRRAMPIDSFWFATADPESYLFTSSVKQEIPDGAVPHFVTNEFLQDDVGKFRLIAAQVGEPVETLYRATGDRPERSRRYREILAPMGFGDEMRAVCRTGRSVWGFACLHREGGRHGYSRDQAALLAAVAPHLGHGLRAALLLGRARDATTDDDERTGLAVIADDLSLVESTAAGARWLAELGEDGGGALPEAVQSVVARLWALEQGRTDHGSSAPVPRVRARTASGRWLSLTAARLSSDVGRTAVIIEPARPADITQLLLGLYGLSRREEEIARLVLRAVATDRIAAQLSISPLTVQQHLKSIFDKTGARSRRELIARVFAEHYKRLPAGARSG